MHEKQESLEFNPDERYIEVMMIPKAMTNLQLEVRKEKSHHMQLFSY